MSKKDDDTSEIDTETTVDSAESKTDLKFDTDFRAIYDHRDATFGNGTSFRDDLAGFRVRSRVDYGITEPLHIGTRFAGTCATGDACNLVFDDSKAQNTWFAGFENIERWGPIVQRSLDISYLPYSLLKDGVANGRREDYWGIVGRLVGRWPQRRVGIRLRAGLEAGYAPVTATRAAQNLNSSVNGLAWNAVVSLMDFMPTHSIGINYAQTGAGWLISSQFRPNEELFEVRYIWSPDKPYWPLLEARIRWRGDIEQNVGASQKYEEFDGYIRLTWEFTFKRTQLKN